MASDSILTTIKKMLGIDEVYEHFDVDIIIHINSALGVLHQIGVGPPIAFSIIDKSAYWFDLLSDATNLEMVKTFIYLRVRLIFDPPATSALMEAFKTSLAEMEWRLSITVRPPIVVPDPLLICNACTNFD